MVVCAKRAGSRLRVFIVFIMQSQRVAMFCCALLFSLQVISHWNLRSVYGDECFNKIMVSNWRVLRKVWIGRSWEACWMPGNDDFRNNHQQGWQSWLTKTIMRKFQWQIQRKLVADNFAHFPHTAVDCVLMNRIRCNFVRS